MWSFTFRYLLQGLLRNIPPGHMGVSVQPAQPAPKVAQQDGMYGEVTVDLGEAEYLNLGHNGGIKAGSAGVPKTDSWLDLKEVGKERRGMHVTFAVRLLGTTQAWHPLHCDICRQCVLHPSMPQDYHGAWVVVIRTEPCMHVPLLRQDVYYIVKNRANKAEKLSILSGVSGYFRPGEMAAVMGPSGSGACAA